MKAIERLFEYFEYKGISPTRFEKEVGMSNGYLATTFKRKSNFGSDILSTILNNCPDLSQEWLTLGTGKMINSENKQLEVSSPSIEQKIELMQKLLDIQEKYLIQLERENKELRNNQKIQ